MEIFKKYSKANREYTGYGEGRVAIEIEKIGGVPGLTLGAMLRAKTRLKAEVADYMGFRIARDRDLRDHYHSIAWHVLSCISAANTNTKSIIVFPPLSLYLLATKAADNYTRDSGIPKAWTEAVNSYVRHACNPNNKDFSIRITEGYKKYLEGLGRAVWEKSATPHLPLTWTEYEKKLSKDQPNHQVSEDQSKMAMRSSANATKPILPQKPSIGGTL